MKAAYCFRCRKYRQGTWFNSFEFVCLECQDEQAEVIELRLSERPMQVAP